MITMDSLGGYFRDAEALSSATLACLLRSYIRCRLCE